MSEVKWIKLTTNLFEDEKIDFIESLPESDAIIVIWVRLLTMAGKSNADGYIMLTENVPYDDSMLAHKFRKPLNIVRLALQTFIKLDMIEDTNNGFMLINWEKHQNIEGLDKIREQNKIRKQRQRANEKLLALPLENVTRDSHVTSQLNHATELDLELDKEKDKIWSLYPNKKGKASAMKSIPKLLKSIGYEKLEQCILKFIKENKKTEIKYIQYGSTFFNGGYMDYLENTKETSQKPKFHIVEVPYNE